jgi:hypothetical protein
MKKFIKILLLILLTINITACFSFSTLDTHINKNKVKTIPKNIIIGSFERRNLSYDPFVLKNLIDLLSYEFFKLDYKTHIISINLNKTEQSQKQFNNLKSKFTSFLFIQGTISENNYGDSIDSKISTSILLKIYNQDGNKIGETVYLLNESLADSKLMKSVSNKLVNNIHESLTGKN